MFKFNSEVYDCQIIQIYALSLLVILDLDYMTYDRNFFF